MKVELNKETQLIISIAKTLGSTGVVVQNSLFQKFNLNYVYKPFSFSELNFKKIFDAVKVLNLKGCAISMPFKNTCIKECEIIDEYAKLTQSANTIINESGVYKGYNTDVYGAKKAIEQSGKVIKSAIVYGTGSVAKSCKDNRQEY